MTRLKNLPENAKAYDVFAQRPAAFVPFTDACEQIMRAPSSLSAGDRELIGAFVSRLNACPYCHDVHNEAVKAYGMESELTAQLQENIETAPVDERLKPLLVLARKMTEGAYRVTDADFEAARAAGWQEDAIMDAIFVSCLFNFMNRLVSTLGIEADAIYLADAGARLREQGYTPSLQAALAKVNKK